MSERILDEHNLIQQRRQSIAKISIAIGSLSLIVLSFMLYEIASENNESYSSLVSSHAVTQQELSTAMIIAGLVLVAISGLITGFVALATSFGVAGPLFRITQNLKLAAEHPATAVVLPIRQGDLIHQQAQQITQAIHINQEHHILMRKTVDEAIAALEAGDAGTYQDAVVRLRSLDEKVRL